ncbi:hypothetical protein WA158_006274 [Blastocystis sp. Blastoise]
MEFLDIGKQCEVCREHDYLPFKCDCCDKYFCLTHRDYVSHNCPNADKRRITAQKCPECGHTIRIDGTKDFKEQINEHMKNECTHIKKPKITKCPVKGCTHKLYAIDTVHCKLCNQNFCTEHRFPDSHHCPSLQKNQPIKNKELNFLSTNISSNDILKSLTNLCITSEILNNSSQSSRHVTNLKSKSRLIQ